MTGIEDVLDFWFGGLREGEPAPPERFAFWFGGAETTDRQIRVRFAADVDRAGAGGYDYWRASPQGTLALLLLLDQFPRNIHRSSPRAYTLDGKAREICLAGLDEGQDRQLITIQRAFFYLPLEHAEDIALQQRSVAAFAELLRQTPGPLRETCRSFLDYAERHRAIIDRFGRFPHRNSSLSRISTAEEEAFLSEPGSSF
ncbi:MAG TPA: DUF924 family protein [Desulfuromonadales bacterium]|jgi:uncharacterized protein (DUF924 family)